ncbi:class F sortase [Streptomyces sp. HUAS TT7]|uniref:class F sortase n=1 Tax=Streptomyces sp. HUAS TT7 TaxID=3447507 RepID=UPI003F65828C
MNLSALPRLGQLAAASVLGLVLSGGLVACGGGSEPAPDVTVSNTASALAEKSGGAMKASKPTRLQIPSADVDTGPVLPLSVDSSGELGVPPVDQADKAGWHTAGVTPGEKGPAVLVAHYDTAKGPALMKNIKKVKVGDTITVGREDGTTATFKIREIEQVDKKKFPTDKVYGDTSGPELRILTCGGPLVDGHRADNIILYANLVK